MNLSEEIFDLSSKLRQYARLASNRLLGTRLSQDGGYKVVVSLEEARLFHRAELNAVSRLLIDKGIFTTDELQTQTKEEMVYLLKGLERDWPEIEAHADSYIVKDTKAYYERSKREGWPP